MESLKSTRRKFCSQACQAISLVAVGALAESCGGSPTSPSSVPAMSVLNGTVVNNTVTLTIDASSPLVSTGSAAVVQATSGVFLVAHTGQDTFSALNALCTHANCYVTGYQSGTYVCPCHGSEYNTSGRVLSGPAPAALHQYATQFVNNVLTISLV
jgi:cytochrome b6-f complex iron-sulfur subunit